MNASLVHELTGAGDYRKVGGTGVRSIEGESPDGTLFSSVFNSAVEGIKTTKLIFPMPRIRKYFLHSVSPIRLTILLSLFRKPRPHYSIRLR